MVKIFITVGTSGSQFNRLLDEFKRLIVAFPYPYELYVQYGHSDEYHLPEGIRGESEAFFSRERARELVKNADLVFSHCGIGSIYNALEYARPTVIVPRLHCYGEGTDDHQLQIATKIKVNPLILFPDEETSPQDLVNFYERTKNEVKAPLDLTNYELADRLSAELQAGKTTRPVVTVVSVGGHLTQALCILKRVKRFHLVTSVDIPMDVGAQAYHLVSGTQFNPWIHFKNIFVALQKLRQIKPASVFSTGGPICIPWAVACRILSIPFIYLDTLSRVQDLSNTARFLRKYKLASSMYIQWPHLERQYPDLKCVGQTFDICRGF